MSITYILTILVYLIILGIHIYVYETIESKQKSILKRRIISLESFIYNLQEGIAGFGDSPYLAILDWNKNWFTKLSEKTV